MVFLLTALAAALQGPPPPDPAARRRCVSVHAPIEQPCTLAPVFSRAAVAELMRSSDQIWWLDGDRLTLVARPPEGEAAQLCCAIQFPLEPVAGTDLQAITVRVPRVEEALLDAMHLPSRAQPRLVPIRGAKAVPAPPRAAPLRGRIDAFPHRSEIFGEERYVTVYVPPDLRPDEKLPVIYLADGLTQAYAPLAEAAARDGRAARAIIVGIVSGRGVTECAAHRCDRRGLEYLIDLEGPEPGTWFGRHMRYVTDEIVPLIETRYPVSPRREHRITAGSSNGASWALAAAALRPDLFGGVIAMSSGSTATAGAAARLVDVRVYAGAGQFEPEFVEATQRTAETARRAGGDVRYRTFVGGHSATMWEIIFAEGIAWLLPPSAEPR